ncbi:MAG: hypothetical protein ABIW84_04450 [Ilumatobacteraceae bacterium]
MKRMGWAKGSMTIIALLLTSCSSSGPKTLSEEDFVDELNAVCDDANRDINRLDFGDRNFFDDVLEVMQTGADDLAKLKPPKDLARDFGDFSDNLDDTISETEDLRDAVDDEDDDAIAESQDALSELAADANDLADSLGADDCVDIGGGSSSIDPVTTDTVTDETTANTPLQIDTTVATEPPVTEPPETDPTVNTTPITSPPSTAPPVDTTPVMTNPPGDGDGLALDASVDWAPPAGFEWTALQDLPGVSTPFGDPVLGPVLSAYWAGRVDNTSTGEVGLLYISASNTGTDWTPEQLEALFAFEGVSGGVDTTTPSGIPARVATGVGSETQFDVALIYLPGNSVLIIAPTGTNVLGILDAFFAANSMG